MNFTTFKQRDAWIRKVLACNQLKAADRIAAISLALFSHIEDGRCNPGYDKFAEALGVHERTAMRRIANIERQGWIKVIRSRGSGNKNNFEFLVPEKVTKLSPLKVTESPPFAARKGDKSSHQKVTNRATKGDTQAVTQVREVREVVREEDIYPPDSNFDSESRRARTERPAPAETQQEATEEERSEKNITRGELNSFEHFWAEYPKKVAK
jgi:hypothetical protein